MPGACLTYRVQLHGLKYPNYPTIGWAVCDASRPSDLHPEDFLFKVDRESICRYPRFDDLVIRATLDGEAKRISYVAELIGGHEIRTADIEVPVEIDAATLHLVVQLAGSGDEAVLLPPEPRHLWTPAFV